MTDTDDATFADIPAPFRRLVRKALRAAHARGVRHGVAKAFEESDHPRDDHGRFVSAGEIHAAKTDPAKAAELRARVTDPEQRVKLDAAVGLRKFGKSKAGVEYASGKRARQEEADEVFRATLGTDDPEVIASVVGAPDDATVKVDWEWNADYTQKKAKITIEHAAFTAVRHVYRGKRSGKPVVQNSEFWVKPGEQGKGIGADVFARQVENAAEHGVWGIVCHAARENPHDPDKPHNGYYTWPRFGYDQSLTDPAGIDESDEPVYAAARERFPGAKTVLDVMATPEGRKWWQDNGTDMLNAVFDLSPGSRSMTVLTAYLEARAAGGKKSTSAPSRTPPSLPPGPNLTAAGPRGDEPAGGVVKARPGHGPPRPGLDWKESTHRWIRGEQLKGVLHAHKTASGRGRDYLENALWNAGVEDPAKPPKQVDAALLHRRLASDWQDLHAAGGTPEELAPLESAMRHAGLEQVHEHGERASFDGAHHEGPSGLFTGDSVRVTRPGWRLPDSPVSLVKAAVEPARDAAAKQTGDAASAASAPAHPVRPSPAHFASAAALGGFLADALGSPGGLPPAEAAARQSAAHAVASRLPSAALARLRSSLSAVVPHLDTASVTHTGAAYGLDPADGTVMGMYSRGDGTLHVDGGKESGDDTHQGVLAHELGHAVDAGPHPGGYGRAWQYSADREFLKAFFAECAEGQLSDYATHSYEEGFAEFCRLLWGSDVSREDVAAKFPRTLAYFASKGLADTPVIKSFEESKHPRDDHGRFVSGSELHAARRDPAKAAELRSQVTDPTERAKLDAAIGPASAPAGPPAPVSHARRYASGGSDPYLRASAEYAHAESRRDRAWERLKDPSVPSAQAYAEIADAEAALSAAREKYGEEARMDLRAVLYTGGGNRLRVDTASDTRWTDAERKRMDDVGNFLEDLLGKAHGDLPRVWFDRPAKGIGLGGRAYYQYHRVHVTRSNDAGTYAHEIGHHLENVIPGARARVAEFLKRRLGDEPEVSLKKQFPGQGFTSDEVGRADDFGKLFPDDPAAGYYVGKRYLDGNTEVLSMGLELLWRDPKRFARTDPEYFDLIVSILQGGAHDHGRPAG